ncbi:MAG: tetratricopeptide repeat protein, partial [Thermoplasmata archaeon]
MKPEVLSEINAFIEEEIYSKLGDREKRMMKVASLFDRPFDADAIFVEEGLDFDTLFELRKKALVRMVADGRYEAHEVIRSYFKDITTHTENERFASKIIPYLLSQGSKAKLGYRNDDAIGLFSNALDLEIDDESRSEALEGLGDVHGVIGQYEKALESYHSALELASKEEVSARIERKIGRIHQMSGDSNAALQRYEKALDLLPDRKSLEAGKLHLAFSQVSYGMHRFEKSIKMANEALDILEKFPGQENDMGKVHSILGLNYIYGDRQDLQRAEKHLLLSLDLRRKANNLDGEAATQNNLGILYVYLGNGEKALQHLNEGLKLAEEIRSFYDMIKLIFTTGCTYYELLGEFDKGESQFNRALEIARETGDEYAEYICYEHLSRIYRFKGELEKALEHSLKFLKLAEKKENIVDQMYAHHERAEGFLAQGKLSDAMLSCVASREIAKKVDDKRQLADCSR